MSIQVLVVEQEGQPGGSGDGQRGVGCDGRRRRHRQGPLGRRRVLGLPVLRSVLVMGKISNIISMTHL